MKALPPAYFIGKVRLPETSIFESEIAQLADAARPRTQIRPRLESERQRILHCRYLVEGLYHTFASLNPDLRLSVPGSQKAYSGDPRLSPFSYQFMDEVVKALEKLGWAKRYTGFITNKGVHVLSTLVPTGYLLDVFESHGILWQRLTHRQNEKTVFVRLKQKIKSTEKGKSKTLTQPITLPTPNTPAVRSMRANLKLINEQISSQAICLHLQNDSLKALSKDIAKKNNPTFSFYGEPKKKGRHINFYDVFLYRVFSNGSIELGGRFYGGWWQIIPSHYRPYITINGLATYEVDYSAFHPTMLYALNDIAVPEGDLYDFNYSLPGHPHWDPTTEPYKTVRGIHKKLFNAYLNDPKGRYRLPYKDTEMIGMSTQQLREQMLFKHPLLTGSQGIGLELQYLDSQIAEYVMLDLLKDGITCLPVHDSFIVDRRFVDKLEDAMNRAYAKFVPGHPELKLEQPPAFSEFQAPFTPDGELDRSAMFAMHESAIHNQYLQSWLSRTRARPSPI